GGPPGGGPRHPAGGRRARRTRRGLREGPSSLVGERSPADHGVMSNDTDLTAPLQEELEALADDQPIEEASDATALKQALDARSEQWHRWIDELRVRAALGGQDAKTVLGDVLGRLEDAAAAFTSLARQAAEDLQVDDLRARSKDAAHDLDRAARTALDRLRGR